MYGKRRDKRDKLGCFKHLTQVIVAGFDPSSKPAKILDKDHTSGGLLIMNAENQRRIKSSLKKDLTSIQKHQETIAYLFEFGYDLVVSCLVMYHTKVLMYRTMVLLARLTKVRR